MLTLKCAIQSLVYLSLLKWIKYGFLKCRCITVSQSTLGPLHMKKTSSGTQSQTPTVLGHSPRKRKCPPKNKNQPMLKKRLEQYLLITKLFSSIDICRNIPVFLNPVWFMTIVSKIPDSEHPCHHSKKTSGSFSFFVPITYKHCFIMWTSLWDNLYFM